MAKHADHEIELKLAIAPGDVGAFRRLSMLREKGIAGPTRRKVFNVYFDTTEQTLRQNGMALRLRRAGGRWYQTLKTAGLEAGAFSARGEWEQVLPGPQLDLSLLRETPLAGLAGSGQMHLTLKPVFTTIFNRTTWLLEMSSGKQVEVALDQGTVECGEKTLAISEVEIELVAGSPATVFDVAESLLEHIALRPDNVSKAGRGYQLFYPHLLRPVSATPVKLRRKWHVDQALQSIVAACLAHFAANVEGALQSNDPEYIHQMRVALRRLRSAIHVFRPADAGFIVAELKWLAHVLGQARDWDVLVGTTLPALIGGYDDADISRVVVRAAKRKQTAARAAACAALVSARHAGLMLALSRWAAVPGALTIIPDNTSAVDEVQNAGGHKTADGTGRPSLPGFAAAEIRRRRHRLLRDATAMKQLSPDGLHRVRIDAKRLRYAFDFFASLFDHGRIKQQVRTLGRLQDRLGAANDANVAISLIKSVIPPQRFVNFAEGWFSAVRHIELTEIDRHVQVLKDLKPLRVKKAAADSKNNS